MTRYTKDLLILKSFNSLYNYVSLYTDIHIYSFTTKMKRNIYIYSFLCCNNDGIISLLLLQYIDIGRYSVQKF